MQDIAIDFAQPADLEAMAGLLAELFTQEADFRPDPERQRQGLEMILDNPALGRRLIEHAVAWAREAGLARVTLLTDADNHRARTIYGRLGFSPSAMTVMRRSLG